MHERGTGLTLSVEDHRHREYATSNGGYDESVPPVEALRSESREESASRGLETLRGRTREIIELAFCHPETVMISEAQYINHVPVPQVCKTHL